MASRIDCFAETPTDIFGQKLREQVEERLKYYDSGAVPKKNVEVMHEAVEEVEAAIAAAREERKRKKKEKKERKRKLLEGQEGGAVDSQVNGAETNGDGPHAEEAMEANVDAVEEQPAKKKKKKKSKLADISGGNEVLVE